MEQGMAISDGGGNSSGGGREGRNQWGQMTYLRCFAIKEIREIRQYLEGNKQ